MMGSPFWGSASFANECLGARIKRLWRSQKYEEVYLSAYDTVTQATQGIGWISTTTTGGMLAGDIPDVLPEFTPEGPQVVPAIHFVAGLE